LDSGVSFLGSWTARIHNPHGIWLRGSGTVFQRTAAVPVGSSGQYGAAQTIDVHPLTIGSFTPFITVSGSFSQNETVTVRIRVEYIDNVISQPYNMSFNSSGTASYTCGASGALPLTEHHLDSYRGRKNRHCLLRCCCNRQRIWNNCVKTCFNSRLKFYF
jgi:hypothetical protein